MNGQASTDSITEASPSVSLSRDGGTSGGDGAADKPVPATLSTDCCDAWRSETNPHGAE